MTTRYSTLFSVILLAASLSLHAAPASPYTAPVDSLLKVYDAMVSESDRYVARRQAAIDSLEALPFSAAHALQVAELYVPYRSDSALHYYNLAIGAGDGDMAVLASIRRIRLLASIGNYASAYRERDKLGHIPPHLLLMYYDALYRLYSEAAMVSRLQSYTDCYNAAANAYSDSLINFCEEHNVRPTEYYRRCITRANNHRDFLSAMAYTDSAFAQLTPEMHDYAIIAFERAVIYRETGDRQMFVQWLIRSAITDVHCGVTDNGSSWMIAEEVYNSGDLKRAHRYINYSVSNANIFNANPRYQQVAPLALIISRTYEDEQQEFNFRLWAVVFLLIAVIIAIVVAVMLFLLMFTYTTERVLYRPDPWKRLRNTVGEEEEEPNSANAYRAKLEAWLEQEKPYCNPDFQLTDLRKVLPLNRTYLSQLINAEYGCSFYQWVNGLRINEAKRLMTEQPEIRMHEVAKLSGFSSPVVFSRVFIRETGIAPSKWVQKSNNS